MDERRGRNGAGKACSAGRRAWLILAAVVFLLAGCSRNVAPKDQVARELDAIKSDASQEMFADVLIGDADLPAEYQGRYDELVGRILDFDYAIKSQTVDKDAGTATVVVTITTYDFGKAYTDTYDQVIKDAAEQKIDEETDIDKYVFDMMFDKMLGLEEKKYTVDVEVHCTRNEDGDWVTDIYSNEDLLDAMTGGMRGAIRAITG
ncbi:MAG: hypothetical protein IJH91_09140 [Mogibacterium sp.]|nr:hypothetical protein [Mogibacterium sp.]